MAELQINLKA